MVTRCIYIPREEYTEATAIVQTTYDINKGSLFDLLLKEMHAFIDKPFALEIFSHGQTVYICFTADTVTSDILVGAIYSVIPEAELRVVDDFTSHLPPDAVVGAAELKLRRSDIYPLHPYVDLQFDSMGPLFSLFSTLPPDDRVIVQIVCKPAKDSALLHMQLRRRRSFDRLLNKLRAKYWFKRGVANEIRDKIEAKLNKPLYRANVRCAVIYREESAPGLGRRPADVRQYLDAIAGGYLALSTIDLNALYISGVRTGPGALKRLQNRELEHGKLLTTTEVASFWHPPDLSTLPNTAQVLAKKGAPPLSLPTSPGSSEISFFGHTNYRDQVVPFGIKRGDRRRHLYIIGKSGVGKSCLLQLLIKSDIENGEGIAVLDPHGDLVDDILRFIPRKRVDDVVILDPSDVEFPASFNPLEYVPEELRVRVAVGYVEIFKKLFSSTWSERLEHLLRYILLALLATDRATILSIRKILVDENYRKMVAEKVPDQVVRHFWFHEFDAWQESFYDQAVAPLIDKVNEFVATNIIRNIVSQPINRFDFRQIMDSKKILLMKVSKGVLGEESASLLGAMIIASLYRAAVSRGDIPVEQRRDFYLYVDEFHNFATDTFAEILSESRKFGLNLTLANQYLGQLSDCVRETIFGNVGNLISFSVGGSDAAVLANEFRPRFKEGDIIGLPFRDFYIRMSIDGETPEPFSAKTLEVNYPEASYAEQCRISSRLQYAQPRDDALRSFDEWDRLDVEERRHQMMLVPGTDIIDLRPFLRRYGTILQLSYLDITDQDLEQLHNAAFRNVQNLQLLSTAITDGGLRHIKELRHLVRLRLDETAVTDAGIQQLMELDRLVRLRLDNTGITDQALSYIRKLPIKRLFIRNTHVTEAGLDYLALMPRLREVAVRGTLISASAIKRFARDCPGVNIHF